MKVFPVGSTANSQPLAPFGLAPPTRSSSPARGPYCIGLFGTVITPSRARPTFTTREGTPAEVIRHTLAAVVTTTRSPSIAQWRS